MKRIIIPFVILMIAAACSSIKVTSDFDKTAQYSAFKTYAFTPEALNLNIEELNRKRLITAVENELSLKGFTKAEKPDVLIDIKISGEKKQTATATGTGGYGYGYGYYRYGWGGGTTTINYDSYTEGTVFVNMIDAAKNEVVWQGRGVGTVDPNASASKREKNINYAVKQIFAQYPPKIK
jgi:hypothetical protein